MDAAIIGKSAANESLKEKLASKGFITAVFENIDEIKGFGGETGNFTIKTTEGSFNAGFIIITEDIPSGDTAFEVYEKPDGSRLPAAFIMDEPYESSAYLTEQALKAALRLAKRKRTVYYLSRFMRTAGKNAEALYNEARRNGINFIKYETLSIFNNENQDFFDIKVNADSDSYSMKAGAVFQAKHDLQGDSLAGLAKKLRLKLESGGTPNEGSSFLFPTITSRKGIFYLDAASLTAGADLEDRLEFTVEAAINEIENLKRGSDTVSKHADVDPAKCALCYTCYRTCPHAAMVPDADSPAMKNVPANCSACGICVAVCPADAIRLINSSSDKDNSKADVKTGPNKLKLFCCENSGLIAVKRLKNELSDIFDGISVSSASCGGELSTELLAAALKDFERVLVVTCMDEACRHFEGNKRAQRSVERVKEMLRSSSMEDSRIDILKASHAMKNIVRDRIREMI